MVKKQHKPQDVEYDLIVVGSGNGACGFLSRYLDSEPKEQILVIEEGRNFFFSSDIAHQYNWLKSYSEGKIFKLHNALTPENIPIISGRASTMGGGGSINYTMIHESSQWLADHIGQTPNYWDELKASLNTRFERPDPADDLSPVAKSVLKTAEDKGFRLVTDAIANIPNQPDLDADLLQFFPAQFNEFGQRTNSGVSIVDWAYPTLTLKTRCLVEQLKFIEVDDQDCPLRCVTVHVKDLETGEAYDILLKENGKLILCAGAATPRLLMPYGDKLGKGAISQQVSDHILLPLGLYLPKKGLKTTPKDNYIPIFATSFWRPGSEGQEDKGQTPQGGETLINFDFFAGEFDRLLFLVSHLFLALLLPNWLKRFVIKWPWLFFVVKNVVRLLIQLVNFIIGVFWGIANLLRMEPWHDELELITAIIKFTPAVAGQYEEKHKRITLNFFAEVKETGFNQDKTVAQQMIKRHMDFLNDLGEQPHVLVRFLLRLLLRLPYQKEQVDDYVKTYSKKFLLTEQHLAGGCLYGAAIDQGLSHPQNTGKVFGAANVHVADLSSVPLPRVSPQMTAYLAGFHVAHRLCGDKIKPWNRKARIFKSIFSSVC